MTSKILALAAGCVLALSAGPALADIDTTGFDAGTVFEFGQVNTATYGQVFRPDAGAQQLTSFSLFLRSRVSGDDTLDLRGYIATWDGAQAGTLLYSSDTVTMNAAGDLQQFLFNTSVAVDPSQLYVAFLSSSDLGAQPQNTFGMPFNNDVIEGLFVFQNNGTDFGSLFTTPWSQGFLGDSDVWFTATFAAVPEPASWALMISGFGLIGASMRRRRPAVVAA